jgi:hypothetical protein
MAAPTAQQDLKTQTPHRFIINLEEKRDSSCLLPAALFGGAGMLLN